MPLDLLRGAELAAKGGGGDDAALEMLCLLSGSWVRGLLRWMGIDCESANCMMTYIVML